MSVIELTARRRSERSDELAHHPEVRPRYASESMPEAVDDVTLFVPCNRVTRA